MERPRRRRPKTMRVKTLIILIMLIFVTAAVVFGVLYYYGKRPPETAQPVSPMIPPHFLYSIYEGKNKFSHPIAVAVDKSGKFYVSNNDVHTVEAVLPNGKAERSVGSPGSAPGHFLYPYGIGILPNGNLLIAETGNYRVQEFTAEGKYVRTFLPQPNNIGLVKPGPVYVDSKGQVYIGDLSGNQVFVLDQKGNVLRKIEDIQYPHGIAADEKREKLYVSDAGRAAVKVYSLKNRDTSYLDIIETWKPDTRFSMTRGLAVDSLGRLYVADTITSSIRVFDGNGEYLFSFGKQGFEDGEFLYPNGIFIDHNDKIYVADWGNNRVQVWGY